MSKKLDPESLGIILLNAFMDEFFPEEKRSVPDTFDLMHYNGIPGSNEANKVPNLYIKIFIFSRSSLSKLCSIFIFLDIIYANFSTTFSGQILHRLGHIIGMWFKVHIDIESNADLSANKVAKHRSQLEWQSNAIIKLTKFAETI